MDSPDETAPQPAPESRWAPPSGPPVRSAPLAAEPAQAWGHGAHPSPPRTPGTPAETRSTSRRWMSVGAVVFATVAAVGLTLWAIEGPLEEPWGDLTGASSGNGTDATGSPPTDTRADDFTAALEANEARFDDWMDADGTDLAGSITGIEESMEAFLATASGLGPDSQADPASSPATALRQSASMDALIESTVATLQTAPASALRNAFVRILQLQSEELHRATAAIVGSDPEALRAAQVGLERAANETRRLCRQYGDRVGDMCA